MEPISLLIDTVISLFEKFINLQQTKRDDNEQVFKEIIEPLYIQLQLIAEDYKLIFRKAREIVIDVPDNPNVYPELYTDDWDLESIEKLLEEPERIDMIYQKRAQVYWNALGEIVNMREKLVLARISAGTMSLKIKEMYKDYDIREFVQNASGLLSRSVSGGSITGGGSLSSDMLLRIKNRLDRGMSKETIVLELDTAVNQMEYSWELIAESYSKLKIKYLSAPNLIKKQ